MDVKQRFRRYLTRVAIALGAASTLVACGDGFTFPAEFGLSSERPPEDALALSEVQLAKGAFVFEGPEGWCIEPRSFRNTVRQSFALVASCNALTAGQVGPTYPAGYATITVGGASQDAVEADALLSAVLGDETTRTRRVTDGLARAQLVPVEDMPSGPVWRATTVVADHPILFSIHAPADSAFARLAGSILIDDLSGGLRHQPAQDAAASETQSAANLDSPDAPGLDPAAFFRRLLNRNGSE